MKRPAVVGIAVGVAVLVALGAGLAWWQTRAPSAQDAAESYLTALSDGNLSTIRTMLPDTLDDDAERVLGEAFASADSYLSDVRVEGIDSSNGVARIRASALLDGERRQLGFGLESRAEGWQLQTDSLPTLRAVTSLNGSDAPAGISVRIGDARAPSGASVPVLPAAYTVSAAPRGLIEGSSTAAVTDEPVEVGIDARIGPGATTLAQEQLDAYAQTCAEEAGTVPEACGIRVPWAADLTGLDRIEFRIEQLPTVAIAEDGRTFAATGGILVATATGPGRGGGQGGFTYRSDDWALRGTIVFDGDEMILGVG